MGLKARTSGKLADAYAILSEDPDYRDAKEAIYQTGVSASAEKLYEVSVSAFTLVGAYKDAAMKLTMDTYAWGGQLYENGEYEKSAEVFASMDDFSDAPARANEAAYAAAGVAMKDGKYDDAAARYEALGTYSDSAEKAKFAAYAAAKEQLEAGNYANAKEQFAALGDYSNAASMVKECDFRPAMALLNAGKYSEAKAAFLALGDYSDAANMARECDYIPAKALYDAEAWQDALYAFRDNELSGYKDSTTMMNDCSYRIGMEQMASGLYENAVTWFDNAGDYSDAKDKASECRYQMVLSLKNSGSYDETIALFTVIGTYSDSQAQIKACYYAQGQMLEAEGNYEDGYAQYTLSGDSAKMKDVAYQNALVELSESNYESAVEWFEKAGEYSDSREQILNIGEYYYATQQYDLAETVYVKVLGTGVAAQRLYELGQYYELVGNNERAAQGYREAGEYNDASDKATALQNEVDYQAAESLYLRGDYEEAKAAYQKISGYKDADNKIMECDNAIAAAAAHEAKIAPFRTTGNIVTFGHYEQDNNTGNGQEEIEWIVLDTQNGKSLLLSRYLLDAKPYNTSNTSVTWETCTLRSWLNKDFLNSAFTAEEQSAILTTTVDNSKSQGYSGYSTNGGNNTQDKIFLLSYHEAFDLYFTSDDARKCAPTDYAIKQGAYTSSSYKKDGRATGWWWLRSPGNNQNKEVLKHALDEMTELLDGLGLEFNAKTRIFPIAHGVEYLGWRFSLTESGKVIRRLKKHSKIRWKHRLRKLKRVYAEGNLEFEKIKESLQSYRNHLSYGNTGKLFRKVMGQTVFIRPGTNKTERVFRLSAPIRQLKIVRRPDQ